MDLYKHRFPIGEFEWEGEISEGQRAAWIEDINALPALLRSAVSGLSEEQLDTPYRDGGWTVRQVVHHIADSHMNSFIRFKLSLTEDNPTIRPYYEDRWAELADTKSAPIELSLSLIEALHERWSRLLGSLSEKDYCRTFFHPESKRTFRLDYNLGVYAWHGKHHLAHITELAKRLGW
ncbi:YfiT family bacillithiol transferase [Paenibacillus montanisoli]